MATIAVNPDQVALVAVDEPIRPEVANVAIAKGQNVSNDGTNGRVVLGGGKGIAITKAVAAKYEVSVLKKGIVDLGDAVQEMAIGAIVYGATDGSLNDAATGAVALGTIIPGWSDTTPRKLLRVDV